MNSQLWAIGLFASLLVGIAGCNQEASPVLSDTQNDLAHDHRHLHGQGHDHEHDHTKFVGAHEHTHEHGHRHDEPLYGGQVFPIGHSHHEEGEAEYHAEVLLNEGGRLTLHVLTEIDGQASPYAVEDNRLIAYAGDLEAEPESSQEILLRSNEETSGEFNAELPDELMTKSRVEVVIPKIVLGEKELSFSFVLRPSKANDRLEPGEEKHEETLEDHEADTGTHEPAERPPTSQEDPK